MNHSPGSTPGIGHNKGPDLEPGFAWRRHAWSEARAQLWKPAPIEVIRRQLRRAKALGLDHRTYSSIVLGSGRDLSALVVTGRAVGAPSAPRVARLRAVERCEMILLAPETEALARRLLDAGLTLAGAAPAPRPGASVTEARAAVRAALDGRRLPSDAVLMIGEGATEKGWAEAARLARFVAASRYFEEASGA